MFVHFSPVQWEGVFSDDFLKPKTIDFNSIEIKFNQYLPANNLQPFHKKNLKEFIRYLQTKISTNIFLKFEQIS